MGSLRGFNIQPELDKLLATLCIGKDTSWINHCTDMSGMGGAVIASSECTKLKHVGIAKCVIKNSFLIT